MAALEGRRGKALMDMDAHGRDLIAGAVFACGDVVNQSGH